MQPPLAHCPPLEQAPPGATKQLPAPSHPVAQPTTALAGYWHAPVVSQPVAPQTPAVEHAVGPVQQLPLVDVVPQMPLAHAAVGVHAWPFERRHAVPPVTHVLFAAQPVVVPTVHVVPQLVVSAHASPLGHAEGDGELHVPLPHELAAVSWLVLWLHP